LAHERRRFGYRRIHDLLALEGRQVNHKRVWHPYKLANLSVRKCRRSTAAAPGQLGRVTNAAFMRSLPNAGWAAPRDAGPSS